MMKCLILSELEALLDESRNGSRNPNVYTNPPNWDSNTAGAECQCLREQGGGTGKGGLTVKIAWATGAGQKTHFSLQRTTKLPSE